MQLAVVVGFVVVVAFVAIVEIVAIAKIAVVVAMHQNQSHSMVGIVGYT